MGQNNSMKSVVTGLFGKLVILGVLGIIACGSQENLATLESEVTANRYALTGERIDSFSGISWTVGCPSWPGYFNIGYDNYSGGSQPEITVYGAGFSSLNQVGITGSSAGKYRIKSGHVVSDSELALTIVATSIGEQASGGTEPDAAVEVIFIWNVPSTRSITKTVKLLPAFYAPNMQTWGQCTWHALTRRLETGRTRVTAYSQGQTITAEPGSSFFPKDGAVLMTAGAVHMAFVDTVDYDGSKTTPDGELHTYILYGTERNYDCHSSLRALSDKTGRSGLIFQVLQRPDGTWRVEKQPQTSNMLFTRLAN